MTQTTKAQIMITLQPQRKQSNIYQQHIETIISEAVDRGLSSFGDPFRELVYSKLEKSFKIKKHQIPFRINAFADAIEETFGSGAKLIEMRIIQALHEKAQGFIYFPKEDLVFVDYVESLRQFPNPSI